MELYEMIGFGVSKIDFLDGTSEILPKTGIIVIVGPNNSGKSVLLRELNELLSMQRSRGGRKWIEDIEITRTGSEEDFRNWFRSIGRIVPFGRPEQGSIAYWSMQTMGGHPIAIDAATHSWISNTQMADTLMAKFVTYHPALQREGLLSAPSGRDLSAPASHPVFQMWDNEELEQRLSNFTRQAFGFPVSINRYAQTLEILRGVVDMPNEPFPPSVELLDAYARLPPLQQEGDGIRSFVGLLLHSVIAGVFVTLIDEPEAFLHPPQAKLLGRHLAKETPISGQVIVATHSNDMLEGILDGSVDREIKIIRVDQTGPSGTRTWNTLAPERVSQLWKDPLLRYSRLLDGLFHKGVIICEADNDCRFYAATLDSYLEGQVEHDLVFTHVGGKGRLGQAARELTSFGIPVAIIGDLDVLQENGQLERIIDAMGGDSQEFIDDLRVVREQIRGRSNAPLVSHLKDTVADIIRRRANSRISDREATAVISAVKIKSGWGEVKRSGLAAFEEEAARAAADVVENLAKIGVFLVPVGELERWYPTLNAGHGMPYVTAVLEGQYHKTLTPTLRSFLEKLSTHFNIPPVAPDSTGTGVL